MDMAFEQLLAQHNQEFKEAEVFSGWMPDDGDYIASLVKLESGQKTKDGAVIGWWKLTGRIEDVADEKLNGKDFTVGFYTSKAYGILKGAARTLANNPHLDDLAEAHAVLEAAIGDVVSVRVKTSWSDRHKKDFTNCYIQEVINTTTEASAEDVPVDGSDVGVGPAPVEEAPATIGDAPDSGIPAEAPPA